MSQHWILSDFSAAVDRLRDALDGLTPVEAGYLNTIVAELSRPEARDPKLAAVKYFLTQHRVEGKTWLEHGSIVFSQYYDTARWVGSELAKRLPNEPIAVYAGAGRSGMFRDGDFVTVSRDSIKDAVKKHEVRLVVATDAACELAVTPPQAGLAGDQDEAPAARRR